MSKKILGAVVTLALVATVFVGVGAVTASAQSVTCANIDTMLVALGVTDAAKVAQAKVAFGCGAATASASYTFTRNLTVGSTGADVTALQTKLGVTPATSYFGPITKAAVVAYQTANGVPGTGFVGPLTLAKLNAGVTTTTTTTTTTTCPAGMTCTPAAAVCPAGFTCTSNTTGATVGTTGVEGTLSVDQGAVSNTTVYEGQTGVQVLNLRLRANTSDISVARVQVNLGTSANVYAKAFSALSVVGDDGKVLASVPLNQSTVSKQGSNYFVTITGFNYLVAKNQYRYLTVAADVYGSVNTTYQGNYTFTLPTDGVRGADGAGLDEYSGTGFAQTVTISTSLTDSADLKLSTNSATPLTGAVIANGGSLNDEADKVTVLVLNLKAEKDSIGVTDILASTTVNAAGNNASTTSAYLYDGSTLVASAAVQANGTIAFNNISGVEGYVIAKDTTKAFTLKVDLRKQATAPGTLLATVLANGISAVNSQGVNITNITGSAVSNALYAQKAGPVFALVGTPSVSKSVIGQTASSTFSTGFTFNVTAQGKDVSIESSGAFFIDIYLNNVLVGRLEASYAKPVSGITGNGPYVITDGNTATFTAQASFVGPSGPFTPAGAIVTASLGQILIEGTTYTYISDTFRTDNSATVTL